MARWVLPLPLAMRQNGLSIRWAQCTWLAASFLMTALSCAAATANDFAIVSKLCQHISENRKKMILDTATNQTEIVWSDGAMLEIGTNFAPALQKLISRPTVHSDIRSFLQKIDPDKQPQWRPAHILAGMPAERYSKVSSMDGEITISVESVYLDYLHSRWPAAKIRIKGEREPLVFVADGRVRACVMPVLMSRAPAVSRSVKPGLDRDY